MEFFLGAIVALLSIVIFNRSIVKSVSAIDRIKVSRPTQATIYEQIAPFDELFPLMYKEYKPTQSRNFIDSLHMTIALTEDKAYWIEANALYCVDIVDGQFVKENGKKVDTMSMDKVQLKEIDFIVDQLSEGSNNDSGNSGHKKL